MVRLACLGEDERSGRRRVHRIKASNKLLLRGASYVVSRALWWLIGSVQLLHVIVSSQFTEPASISKHQMNHGQWLVCGSLDMAVGWLQLYSA